MGTLRKCVGPMLLLLLSGCGANPAGFEKLPDLKFGEAALYVYRADREQRSAPTLRILVDDAPVGSLPPDAYLSLIVPGGARTVQAGLGDGGIFSTETVIKTTLVADDRNHYFLEVVPSPRSDRTPAAGPVPGAYFTLTPESSAIAVLKTLRAVK